MRRRILLLITDLEIGGTPTVLRELALRLRNVPDVHVQAAGLSGPGPLRDQLLARGIECTALGARGAWDLKIAGKLHRLLRRERIDTVVSFLIHANALAAALRSAYPHARYFQSIQTTQPRPAWHWALERWVHRAAEKIFVPSLSVATVAQRWAGVSASKIVIIPNAIDPAEFRGGTGGPPVNREHGRATHADIGFIGRLDPIKRIPDLLHAMTLLPANMRLHIFGEGGEQRRIEADVKQLGLGGRVIMHGAIARPQEALAMIDLLVLPSEAEGFGLVLIEAMASGVPVVATNVAGIRDVVSDGRTGLLVPARSPERLGKAIARMIDEPGLRQRLIENALTDVNRRFTWEAVFPKYLRLFDL